MTVLVFSFHGNLLALAPGLFWPAGHPTISSILLILQYSSELP
jgi:hypothetical protein